ncbi:unnamed protein product [Prunus armeniaca]|uniref:Glutamate receptor n=1 Tax=Prunus armeniaca TaxID=36596 RepID=A0A6J5UNR4_PRUAR|nr:unnamed protein product [Prunus armeniaca]
MSGFAPLFYFLITVLVLREGMAFGRANKPENEPRMGIIGAIIDNSSRIGKEERVAIEMAVEDFHATGNQRLALHIRNSQREDPLQAALAAYISNAIALIKSAARDLIDGQQVQAILGPHTWEETSLVVKVGSETHTPIVSFAEATPKWATELWPFLVHASHDRLKQMEAIADIVQSWEWHRVTVIYQDRDSLANEVLPHLSYALRQVGAEIGHLVALQPFASSLIEELEKIQKDQCRVFVVHLSVPLAAQLFEKAKEMKMMEKDYVWITTDPITSLVNSFNASSISSMQGIIGVKSYFPESGNQFQDFYHRFCIRFRSEHPEEGNNEPGIFAAQAYDAARAVALASTEGSKGRKLLAKLLRSDFHGLSGRIKFTDQNLAPQHVFQIINVVGRSYRELGYWSDGIRFSKTIGGASNYPSMKDLGPVVWPGEPWYTPKGWTVPIQPTVLRIGVPNGSTFKEYVNVEKDPLGNNLSFTGLAIDLFKATLEELPYHLPYELRPFKGTHDSLVEQIHLHNFDAVVDEVAIVSRRYEHAEFTQPYTEAGLVMIVPVMSKTCNKAWLFMRPFTKPMWALIGAINVYNGFVVWLIERNHCSELKGSVLNQIGSLIWLSFTTLFSLHGGKLHSNLSRMTMVVWLFMALIITQTYTANLASMLTVQQLEPTITDVDALRQSNAMVGYCKGSFVSAYLKEVLGIHNIKQFDSIEEYAEALKSEVIAAAFLEAPLAKIFLRKYCKVFMEAGPTFKVGGFGFVFPRGSPLVPEVTEAMLKVIESGKLRDLENNMLASLKCLDSDAQKDSGDPSLSPNSFWVLFVFTGGTSTTALVVYTFFIHKSVAESKTNWTIMLAAMKKWGNPNRRFSRRDSDINAESPAIAPNASALQA